MFKVNCNEFLKLRFCIENRVLNLIFPCAKVLFFFFREKLNSDLRISVNFFF